MNTATTTTTGTSTISTGMEKRRKPIYTGTQRNLGFKVQWNVKLA